MSFGSPTRVILARLDGTAGDDSVLGYAADFAKRFNSHVKAVHVRLEPASLPLLAGADRDDDFRGFGKSPEALSEKVASDARAHFTEWAEANGFEQVSTPAATDAPSAEWQEFYGDEPSVLVKAGRVADLLVTARPNRDAGLAAHTALEATLFGSERPVLMTPPVKMDIDPFTKPVVGWNASPQATRALAAGLPVLKASIDPAAILTVPDKRIASDGSEVADYLAWHGVRAALAEPEPETDVGLQLQRLVGERGGGILICGAYSRSRFRQMILGGVTSFLIEQADFPVMMSC